MPRRYKVYNSKKSFYPFSGKNKFSTARQRKGMILQAPSTPPVSNRVYGKAELDEALHAVTAFGLIPPPPNYILGFGSFSVNVPFGVTSDFVIDSTLVLANTDIVSGQPYSVYGFAVEPTNFITNVPTVNYNVVNSRIGLDLNVNATIGTTLGFIPMTNTMFFGCPFCYVEGRIMYSQSVLDSDSSRSCVITQSANLTGITVGNIVPFNETNDEYATAVSITVPGSSSWTFRVFVAFVSQV